MGNKHLSMRAILFLFCLLGQTPLTRQQAAGAGSGSHQSPPNILFLIADDWSYPHAGVLGDASVRTPVFDRLAREGALFHNAYCASPSCSPSRASILSGKYPHELGDAGNLWSVISVDHPNWMSLLENAGYHTGKAGKGWGPGEYEPGGYTHNPAGRDFPDFKDFLSKREGNKPFAFWFGSSDPHRPYDANTGIRAGMDPEAIKVPGFLPDLPCVRNDIMDYYYEVERFDRECGAILRQLEEAGLLDNTLVIMTSDNGMPFPRAKANLYDYGTRMPLAIYWKDSIEAGTRVKDFVNFIDFAPTVVEAAGLVANEEFSGKSLMGLLQGKPSGKEREMVFLERERHANVRSGDLSYPMRAIRTHEYLYIRNFEPGRWPAGDPATHQSVGQYGDVDNSITKFLMMEGKDQPEGAEYFRGAFSKRPSEELYILASDPFNLNNVAGEPRYAGVKRTLRTRLENWMEDSGDLRYHEPGSAFWDRVLYTPDYQFSDFNLREEISGYRMLRRDKANSFTEYSCDEGGKD